jgi:Na+/H+-dicarboxylate symporter
MQVATSPGHTTLTNALQAGDGVHVYTPFNVFDIISWRIPLVCVEQLTSGDVATILIFSLFIKVK